MAASPQREQTTGKPAPDDDAQAEMMRQDARCQPDAKRQATPPQAEDMRQDAQCPPTSGCECDD